MFFLETFLQSSIFTLWWNCCACQTHPNERCSLALKTSQNCKQCIPGLCKLMKYQSVCGRIEGNNSHVLSRPSSFLLPSRGGYLAWTAATVTPDPSPSPVSKCLGLPVAHIWQDIWPKYIPFGFNFLSLIFAMGCYDVLWGWVGPFFALPMACDRITMVLEVSMQEQS